MVLSAGWLGWAGPQGGGCGTGSSEAFRFHYRSDEMVEGFKQETGKTWFKILSAAEWEKNLKAAGRPGRRWREGPGEVGASRG